MVGFVGALLGFGMVDYTVGYKLLSIQDAPSVNLLPNKSRVGFLFLRGLF